MGRLITGTRILHRTLPPTVNADLSPPQNQAAELICVRRAIAQRNPTISRAIAVVTTTLGLPVATSRRYRAQSLTCAFQRCRGRPAEVPRAGRAACG
jgi:hypothetical protein